MEGYNAFRPRGDTMLIMGSTPGPTASQAGGPQGGDVAYLLANMGSNDAYIGYGASSGAAAAGAVVPIIGQNASCIPVPARSQRVVTLAPVLFFAAATAAGQTPVAITPGDGT
jgi:hypothetical protein